MANSNQTSLPAYSLVESLVESVKHKNVIIGAPPGAGKSTVLPLALLDEVDGKILVMQPRRVVVRNLAHYMASQLDEKVGQRVGYRIRGESKTSAATQLEIITEGVLARLIQADPELSGVSVIIFDEFHERNVHSDFGLALALDVQQSLRDDLRLLVMSATLELSPLKTLLPDADVLTTQGRSFPVELVYTGDVNAKQLHDKVVSVIKQALVSHSGDILVFLPGQGAIRRISTLLDTYARQSDLAVYPLYGALSFDAQRLALLPDVNQRRKVILATNIAETSLTIEGVEVVIDSGLENQATYSVQTGFTTLSQQRISQASATQRAGRAGRLGPGICYRLWSSESHHRLSTHTTAEIQRIDVTSLLLDTLCWGCEISELAMLSQPDSAALSVARSELQKIAAINANGAITAFGRKLAAIPCHPKLASMLLSVSKISDPDLKQQCCVIAPVIAALAEDYTRNIGSFCVSEYLLNLGGESKKRLIKQATRYTKFVEGAQQPFSFECIDENAIAVCIALAFPDRIGFKRGSSYKLAGGRGAELSGESNAQWLAVLHGQQVGIDIRIILAEPIDEKTLKALFPDAFTSHQRVGFNLKREAMEAREVIGFGAIELEAKPIGSASDKAFADAWFDYLVSLDDISTVLPASVLRWWRRIVLARKHGLGDIEWPVSLLSLLYRCQDAVSERLGRCKTLDEVKALPWQSLLVLALDWQAQQVLDTELPDTIAIPSGRRVSLRYESHDQVILSVKMQEMYGCNSVITIAGGKLHVIVELLSPAGRPLQTTSDLATFWQGSYKAVQKEMKGRYPKHFWPDEPATSNPTTKTKRAMER